jgi:hypothetical protein
MVHCRVTLPYSSPTHPVEYDDSSRGNGDCNALGGYTRRGRDIGRFGTSASTTGQYDGANIRYGKGKIHVQAHMMYYMSL